VGLCGQVLSTVVTPVLSSYEHLNPADAAGLGQRPMMEHFRQEGRLVKPFLVPA
jgi:hypothetical protein